MAVACGTYHARMAGPLAAKGGEALRLVPHQATFALLMVSAFATISRSFGWLAA